MANFKQQFFLQFASLGLAELIADYRTRYEPKKGDRFNVEGITYEIGPASMSHAGIEFEVSSKIPQDELPSKADMVKYFEAVKDLSLDIPDGQFMTLVGPSGSMSVTSWPRWAR